MADANVNIFEYERILLGQQQKYWATFKGEPLSLANKKEFGIIWRYAIEKLLRWTPEEAVKYLDTDIINTLKLNTTFYAINFNPKVRFIGDYKSAIQLAFPEKQIYDFKQETLDEYKKVAKKDEWLNDTTKERYNKKFFLDVDGFERARIILNYLIKKYYGDCSPIELYDIFSNKPAMDKFCKANKLDTPRNLLYEGNMIEYLNDAYEYGSKYLYYNNIIKSLCKKKKRLT